jgi:hypothetical protein
MNRRDIELYFKNHSHDATMLDGNIAGSMYLSEFIDAVEELENIIKSAVADKVVGAGMYNRIFQTEAQPLRDLITSTQVKL